MPVRQRERDLLTRTAAAEERARLTALSEPGWPPAVQAATYRIVQESLTNVRKYAPGSAVTVDLVAAPDRAALIAAVTNTAPPSGDARPAPQAGPPTGRNGLAGLYERTAQLGGHLTAGPTPDGGFQVRATLPCPA
ncbi:sensor histidine kinase [Streptomyces sp. NPDC059009]|uniref:sensor histidine kinase n=1 Tax=Streptomyces sp. NPDC059009 TaxID=3346694 RepID=UPI0036B09500